MHDTARSQLYRLSHPIEQGGGKGFSDEEITDMEVGAEIGIHQTDVTDNEHPD